MTFTMAWLFGALFLNSLIGLIGVFSLFVNENKLKNICKILVAFSAGVLLGGAFFHLLTESLLMLPVMTTFGIAIAGFLSFFILEEYFHWHNCEECEIHPYSYLMIVGDSIHNFIDGLVLAGVFIVNVPLGIVTTILILGHEIPQELGVFAVLVSGGIKKTKAIWFSFLAQCFCILGGIVGVVFIMQADIFAQYILPFAAGGFIYLAASDLIPEIHKTEGKGKIASFVLICLGLGFIISLKILFKE